MVLPLTAKTIVTELVFFLQFLQEMESVSDHLIREMNIIVLCNSLIFDYNCVISFAIMCSITIFMKCLFKIYRLVN